MPGERARGARACAAASSDAGQYGRAAAYGLASAGRRQAPRGILPEPHRRACVERGSRASRRPSPTRLNAIVVVSRANPGTAIIHQAVA